MIDATGKTKAWFVLAIFLLIAIVLLSGCVFDNNSVLSSKFDSVPNNEKNISQSESSKNQTFNVGESATDNEIKVTLTEINFVSKIDEKNPDFLIDKIPPGKQYIIIDLVIENILSDKTQVISILSHINLIDQERNKYNIDFNGLNALNKKFKDGGILPGMKKSGGLVYLVPIEATGLKLIYPFDSFTKSSAVFNIN